MTRMWPTSLKHFERCWRLGNKFIVTPETSTVDLCFENVRRKPNFFIVGAAKSGTTALWEYLKQNSAVFMPESVLDKEPAYFSPLKRRRTYEQYVCLFDKANSGHVCIGEASTAYLTDPESAQELYEFNRDAKIIIMLRNPAERAYSCYNWMVQEGYEYAPNFETALKLEDGRSKKVIPNYWEPEYYWDYMYFQAGCYAEQVKRYLDLFQDKVLVRKYEDFVRDFRHEYATICDFLDISVNEVESRTYNASRSVHWAPLQFLLRKLNSKINRYQTKYLNRTFRSKKCRDRLLYYGLRSRPPAPMRDRVRKHLLKRYEPNVYRLSQLINMDCFEWLKGE